MQFPIFKMQVHVAYSFHVKPQAMHTPNLNYTAVLLVKTKYIFVRWYLWPRSEGFLLEMWPIESCIEKRPSNFDLHFELHFWLYTGSTFACAHHQNRHGEIGDWSSFQRVILVIHFKTSLKTSELQFWKRTMDTSYSSHGQQNHKLWFEPIHAYMAVVIWWTVDINQVTNQVCRNSLLFCQSFCKLPSQCCWVFQDETNE